MLNIAYELCKRSYIFYNNALYLNVRFSGYGTTLRGDTIYIRPYGCFDSFNLKGIPVTLEHPYNKYGYTDMLNSDTDYQIIGYIEDVLSDYIEEIRVIVKVIDPIFIDFFKYNEELIQYIDSSPAVESRLLEDNIEEILSINHLALLIQSDGYWSKYINTKAVKG